MAKFPEVAAVVSDLKTVSRGEGATPGRIGQYGHELMRLPMVESQMKKLGFDTKNLNQESATRQVLVCSLDPPAVGTINRTILRWILNFEGAQEKLDGRRTFAMAELSIHSRNTYDRREADAIDILTSFLLSATESPCRFGGNMRDTEALFTLKAQVILELRQELAKETAEELARRLTFEPRRDLREPVIEELMARFPRGAAVAAASLDGGPDEHIRALLQGAYRQALQVWRSEVVDLTVDELRLSGTDRDRKSTWLRWSERNGFEEQSERGKPFLELQYLQSREVAIRNAITEAVKIEAADIDDSRAWRRALGLEPSGDRSLV